ncbi:hypothetical protein Ancab_023617, partial [Ancistrocladus abbreviatus]
LLESTPKPQDQWILVGGSECGTKLLVTSTLDSPDRSKFEIINAEQEIKSMEEKADDPTSTKSFGVEGNGMPTVFVSDFSSSVHREEFHEIHGYADEPVVVMDSPQFEHEAFVYYKILLLL